ncbi:hypothetical protein [Bifidobacterium crudilactis]|uniref:hypothetical protein n=1 Tax=Bifidobacterium crudilactis TaxID=327277 RepID=UPI002357DD83|nr:hypothetical protein [Bifidobacterium crudilactis]MCI2148819.1 hypothetical protein [Bifidobacterium crudilactis]MCI2158315.1 hypothetical protein [Bifidobacterium crudilactis]
MDGKAHEKNEDSAEGAPSRRSRLMRGVVTPVLGLLAVACIVLGIMNATVWKPSRNISADTSVTSRYITTDPGVLNLVDDQVDVTLKAADAQATVCMAIGYAQDVSGWLAGHRYTRITGLDTWNTLEQRSTAAASAQSSENAVAFQDSDMWLSTKCATGSVSMKIADDSNRTVLIADTDASAAQDANSQGRTSLTMSWVRTQVPDFAMPLYFAGGLLAVLGVMTASVFAMEPERRRKREAEGHEEQEPEITVLQAFTGTLSPIGRGIRSAVRSKSASKSADKDRNGKRRDRSRRHLTQDEAFSAEPEESLGTPKIIDAGSRNMVADQQHKHRHHGLQAVVAAVEDEMHPVHESGDGDAERHSRHENPHENAQEDRSRSDAERSETEREHRSERSSRRAQRMNRSSKPLTHSEDAVQASSSEETTVISNEDLAAFFARLSSEEAKKDNSAEDKADDSANRDAEVSESAGKNTAGEEQ